MNATLKLPIMSENQLKYLKEARDKLSKAGVTFDTEYDLKEGIFDWELDWSLKNAELLENKTLQFNVYSDEKIKYIVDAKNKLKKASVFFDSKLDNEDKIVWELNEIRGAELVIRKTRKEPTKGVKVVKPNLKVPILPTPAYRRAYEKAFRKHKRVHIISRDKKWAVMKENKSKASRLYDEKIDAINHADRLRNKEKYEIVIHKKDGSIEEVIENE